MKINKRNPLHWLYLIISTFWIILFIPVHYLSKRTNSVLFYGHKLNGNLFSFYKYLEEKEAYSLKIAFITLDRHYHHNLTSNNLNSLLLLNPIHVIKILRSKIIITDHGMHNLILIRKLTRIKFIDVWHGVPFKGFDSNDFKSLHDHYEIWVSSEKLKDIYVNQLGFKQNKVVSTGYSRVDMLINKSYDKKEILKKYNIPEKYDKYILMAPTWKQDDNGRSIIPFNDSIESFFGKINSFAQKNNTLVIFRSHLNSNEINDLGDLANIIIMPYANYPIAEDFLAISDMLISDWSSIVFDFLALQRPTIYLDVPAPFKKNFTIDPKYRFGDKVRNTDELIKSMKQYIKDPKLFNTKYSKIMKETEELIYGDTLDGKASNRYFSRIENILKTN